MRQIFKFPPNIKEIEKVFGPDKKKTLIYCYGEDIYNPHKIELEQHILVHEEVHVKQQRQYGRDYWWMRYLEDPQFRLEQELEAYAVQYAFVKTIVPVKISDLFLDDISAVLASEVYGNILNIHQAKTRIRFLLKDGRV